MGRKHLQSLPHLTEDAARLVDDLQNETDRGAALLGAAFLDDVLEVMLRSAFVDDSEAVNKLISSGRPLESFGVRAHLAYCMGLLAPDIYHDINIIREIRNDFAHRQPAVFEHPQVKAKCQTLKCVSVILADDACTCRDRLIVTVVLIANHLMIASSMQQHALPAKDFTHNGFLRLK
jgi:DNA-binding MltR family transcriptional regulator